MFLVYFTYKFKDRKCSFLFGFLVHRESLKNLEKTYHGRLFIYQKRDLLLFALFKSTQVSLQLFQITKMILFNTFINKYCKINVKYAEYKTSK